MASELPSLSLFLAQLPHTFHQLLQLPERDASLWLNKERKKAINYNRSLSIVLNSFAPIHRLPEELLRKIITVAIEDTKQLHGSLSWLRITHVCHQWREIALSTSALWTAIDLHTRQASTFLHRSGRAGISVCWHPKRQQIRRIAVYMNMLSPHTSHLVHLDVRADQSTIEQFLAFLECHDLECLRSITLTCPDPEPSARCIPFVPRLGPNNTMERIQFSGVLLDWGSPVYAGLKVFDIEDTHDISVPAMEEFLQVLDRCPELEFLEVVFSGPVSLPGPHPVSANRNAIELRHCRRVVLNQVDPFSVGRILEHLVLPHTTFLELQAEKCRPGNHDLLDIFPARIDVLPALRQVRFLTLLVSFEYIEVIATDVKGQSGAQVKLLANIEDPECFGEYDEDVSSNALLDAASIFSDGPIEEICFSTYGDCITTMAWIAALSKFPHVRSFRLRLRDASEWDMGHIDQFMKALEVSGESILCPKLVELHLTGLSVDSEILGLLRLASNSRKVHCVPLNLVTMCCCEFLSGVDRAELEKAVQCEVRISQSKDQEDDMWIYR
ncbi:unnamed protein product [Somion occarium]|uniref:F-box domain-containing protein n=1 Tax=Somion occarium TaxID=3059160 RepID=A0ABP1E6F5_9APHY